MIVLNKSIKIFFNRIFGPVVFRLVRLVNLSADRSSARLKTILASYHRGIVWHTGMEILRSSSVDDCELAGGSQKMAGADHAPSANFFMVFFQSYLAGVAFALNTPNRIGEYGGRMLYLEGKNRIQSVSLTVAGSISQLVVTLTMGAVGVLILESHLAKIFSSSNLISRLVTYISMWVITIAVVCTIFISDWDGCSSIVDE